LSRQRDHLRNWYGAPGQSPALVADPIVQSLFAILVVSIVFLKFPGIDPWFTSLFYDDKTGFPVDRLRAFTALRTSGDLLVKGIVVVLIGSLVVKLLRPLRPSPIRPSYVLYLLSSLALGPGLLVNVIFKEHWGRPRPANVYLFGGDGPFISVWRMTDFCHSNCSFVSGEASTAIWLVAAAILLPPAWRRRGRVLIAIFAILLSLNRIAFGRHFLSDVLMAWALTALVLAVLYRLIVEAPPAWLAHDRLEAGLARFSLNLRRLARRGGRSRPDSAP
jgi:membrane-associated PAP2 superfamily phosphatase